MPDLDLSGWGAIIAGVSAAVATGIAVNTNVAGVSAAVATGIAAYVGVKGVGEYQRAGKRDHSRQMVELFDRFYTKTEYRDVYLAFDDANATLRDRLVKVMKSRETLTDEKDQNAEWALTAYLNFFEMVAMLVENGQISSADYRVVFCYPVEQLKLVDGMSDYLQEYGYRGIQRLRNPQ